MCIRDRGGVLSINREDFIKSNGYPNNFWGWGGEDDVLNSRLQLKNIDIDKPNESVIDLEEMTFEEKNIILKQNQYKEMKKWELNREDVLKKRAEKQEQKVKVVAKNNEVEVAESSGTVTIGLPSAITANVTGALTGNADTATALATGRTIGMTGDVVWTSASFTGAGNVTGSATIQAGAVENSMLADDAVGADELAANAVVNASVASGAAIDATKIHDGSISNTEFGHLNNVSSNIQTQIDAKTTLTAASNEATALAIALG